MTPTSSSKSAPRSPDLGEEPFFLAALRLTAGVGAGLLITLAAGCSKYPRDVSGTYIATGGNEAILLQIVERTDRSIVGRMQIDYLKPGAEKVSNTEFSVTGAASNGVLALTLENTKAGFLGGLFKSRLSGAIAGDSITLSGGPEWTGMPITLREGYASTFEAQLNTMADVAAKTRMTDQRIAAYKQMVATYQKNLEDVAQLASWLEDHAGKMRRAAQELDQLPGKYHDVTLKMGQMLAKERAMPAGCCSRSTEYYAMNSVGYGFDSMHYALRSTEYSWDYAKGQINDDSAAGEIAHAQAFCKRKYPGCAHLADTLTSCRAAAQALAQAFESTETDWGAEKAHQWQLQKEAGALARQGP